MSSAGGDEKGASCCAKEDASCCSGSGKCTCGDKCQCGSGCGCSASAAGAGPAKKCVDGKAGNCGCGADCKCPPDEAGCCEKAGCNKPKSGAGCGCKSGGECKCGPDCKCPAESTSAAGSSKKCVDGKAGNCGCGADCKCPPDEAGCCVKAGCNKPKSGAGCGCKSGGECKCGPDCKCPSEEAGCCAKTSSSSKPKSGCGCKGGAESAAAGGKSSSGGCSGCRSGECDCGPSCQCSKGGACSNISSCCAADKVNDTRAPGCNCADCKKSGCKCGADCKCSGGSGGDCCPRKHAKLVLTYFDTPGRAEPIRLALKLGKVPFDDVRVQREEWPTVKAQMPFGQMPVLDVDGVRIAETTAILTYVGRITGIFPVDPLEGARVLMLMLAIDTFVDTKLVPTFGQPEDSESFLSARAKIANESLPALLRSLTAQITLNGGRFLAGDSFTVADLKFFMILGLFKSGKMTGVPTEVVAAPELDAYMKQVQDVFAAAGVSPGP